MKKRILFFALTVLLPLAGLAKEKRPNILFAFADDRGKYASAYAKVDSRPGANTVVKTPTFDRIAEKGVLFKHAFVTAPSCTPCRSSLLSGQYFFRTGMGAILQGAKWDAAIPSYPLMLRDAGYHIGETYKVWTPGTPRDAPYGAGKHGYEKSGSRFNGFSQMTTKRVADGISVKDAKQVLYDEVMGNFNGFLDDRDDGKPFCYWFGPTLVHRKWTKGSGRDLWGINPDDLKGKLPKFLPDVHERRAEPVAERLAVTPVVEERVEVPHHLVVEHLLGILDRHTIGHSLGRHLRKAIEHPTALFVAMYACAIGGIPWRAGAPDLVRLADVIA